MKKNNMQYNEVITRLHNLHSCEIIDCYDHPEYLQNIFKQVYGKNFPYIINQIKTELGDWVNDKKINIFLNNLKN